MLLSHYALDDSVFSVALLPESEEDYVKMAILNSAILQMDERLEMGLLWNGDGVRFPDSYPMVAKRFSCLERRLVKNYWLCKTVSELIEDYAAKGYILVVTVWR